jgi:hypothetical protein
MSSQPKISFTNNKTLRSLQIRSYLNKFLLKIQRMQVVVATERCPDNNISIVKQKK